MRELDPGLPLTPDLEQLLEIVLFPARVATMALGVLGMMGAMLSITGIFGMAAYSVSKRLRELGIRIALGAQRKEVLHAALGRPLKLLAIGSAAGLILGILASRVLAFIVYQATPRDPLVLAGVVVAMVLLGLLATWIPAQRALVGRSNDPAARRVVRRGVLSAAMPYQQIPEQNLRTCFVDDVERCLGCPPKARESCPGYNFSDSRFPCLRAQAKPNLLRSGTGRTEQGGERVINPSDGIQVVFQLVVGKRFHDHPRSIVGRSRGKKACVSEEHQKQMRH